ncbi:sensor histidine kinase [Promicromonospora sukumoe]|uniref:sensor histidine kinase n=1 Tax=Promicromonospora sukumoe TaxID=88382 RepID=UPI00036FD9D6|nr:HAMP domain-containing sensor histidine kinase [Promicromonospora sukumoe]
MSQARATAAERALLRRTSRRLGLQTGALVLVCLLVVAVTAVLVVARGYAEQDERRLESVVATAEHVEAVDPGVWVAIESPDGLEVSAGLPDGLPDLELMAEAARTDQELRRQVSVPSGTYETLTGARPGRVVQAVLDPSERREELALLVVALSVAGGVGVLLATVGGWWFARRAVRPTAEALAMQRRFVADAGHELRTPLTLLSTRAQLLRRRVTQSPADHAGAIGRDVDGLLADTAALTEILDDLLVAADPRSVDPVGMDLAAVVREVVEAAGPAAEERGVRLRQEGETTAPVLATPAAVRRAVTALVDNAVDHADGEVRVAVQRDRDGARVVVEDDGPGFAGGGTDLFERFASHRGREDASADRRHYGLGLALVAEIAAQHGGDVTAAGRADGGHGARLTLTLPGAAPRRR